MGKVMAAAKAALGGVAEMSQVSAAVKAALNPRAEPWTYPAKP